MQTDWMGSQPRTKRFNDRWAKGEEYMVISINDFRLFEAHGFPSWFETHWADGMHVNYAFIILYDDSNHMRIIKSDMGHARNNYPHGHSSMLSAAEWAAIQDGTIQMTTAGDFKLKKEGGKLVIDAITNRSGHFKPTEVGFKEVVLEKLKPYDGSDLPSKFVSAKEAWKEINDEYAETQKEATENMMKMVNAIVDRGLGWARDDNGVGIEEEDKNWSESPRKSFEWQEVAGTNGKSFVAKNGMTFILEPREDAKHEEFDIYKITNGLKLDASLAHVMLANDAQIGFHMPPWRRERISEKKYRLFIESNAKYYFNEDDNSFYTLDEDANKKTVSSFTWQKFVNNQRGGSDLKDVFDENSRGIADVLGSEDRYGEEKKNGDLYGVEQFGNLYGAEQVGNLYGAQKIGNLYGAKHHGNLYGAQKFGNLYGAKKHKALMLCTREGGMKPTLLSEAAVSCQAKNGKLILDFLNSKKENKNVNLYGATEHTDNTANSGGNLYGAEKHDSTDDAKLIRYGDELIKANRRVNEMKLKRLLRKLKHQRQ